MNKNTPTFILAAFFLIFASLHANAHLGSAASDIRAAGTTEGLCTENNSNRTWVQLGWCDTIYEGLVGSRDGSDNQCQTEKFDELLTLAKQGKIEGLEEICPNYQQLANTMSFDKRSNPFAAVMQQVIAGLVTMESSWEPRAEGPVIQPSNNSAKGLLQLSDESVSSQKYACGCKDVSSDAELKSDPHLNLKCGTYIAMAWVAEDKNIGTGSGEGGSRGIARYFQPFRNIDKTKRNATMGKVKEFCENMRQNPPVTPPGTTTTAQTTY